MPHNPMLQLDLEFAFITLTGACRCLSALMGAAHSIDASPADLSALVDLITEKAETAQRLSGFGAAKPG